MTLTDGVFSSACQAQTCSSYDWTELKDIRLGKGWLHSENAAGLVVLDGGNKSEVSLYGNIERGGLKQYYTSEDIREFGVQATSLCRLSGSIAMQGEIGYLNLSSMNHTGSYFIDPARTPFDLMEYTDENKGDKRFEEYHLLGGVGVEFTRWLSIGISFDYTSANYAKNKDLRHTNSLMDLTFIFGGMFHFGKRVDLGLDYHYHRRNETLLLSSYGTQDKRFVSLLDYGAFFGMQEVFGEVGYTKENENKPLFDKYHGCALQLSWCITEHLEWFNEVGFRLRNGYYGDPSHSTVVYAEHKGDELFYKGVFTLSSHRNAHTLILDLCQDKVENFENIYSYRTEETGRNYIEYLGQREVGERTRQRFKACYTGRFGLKDGLSHWNASLDASLDRRRTKASNYPDYRRQDITWWRVTTSGAHNILSGRNCYTVSLRGYFGSGSGEVCKDGRYVTTNDGKALTRTRNDLLMQEWEYLTATQAGVGIDAGYSRILGGKVHRVCITLRYDLRKAFDTDFLGSAMRHVVSARIGYKF